MCNRLLQILSGRKVAIVGSGTVYRDFSGEIDSADVVVRFNDFYNMQSGMVGTRTDVILQTVSKAWFDRFNSGKLSNSLQVVKEQRPAIFIVKRPDNYSTDTHAVYGNCTRIDNLSRLFEPWWRFTTGTAALCYLSENLANAEVKCYGFSNEGDEKPWKDYIAGDAAHYAEVAEEERIAQKAAIAKLESINISSPGTGEIPKCIVVPVKANSERAPGKNKVLLRSCLEKLQTIGLPVYVTGDDVDLLHNVKDICTPVPLPAIQAYDDVTNTLRKWQVETDFCGDIALVQCTSPRLRPEWVGMCFEAISRAPVSATCLELDFKPTALFRQEHGVFVPCSQALPAATVARQLLPRTVRITGAVESFHTDAIAFNSFFECGTLEPVIINESDSLDVDTVDQLEVAKEMIKERNAIR